MSINPFLNNTITLESLTNGTGELNVYSTRVQSLSTNKIVKTDANKQLVSGNIESDDIVTGIETTNNYLQLQKKASEGSSDTNTLRLYAKNDGNLYYTNEVGTDVKINATAGVGFCENPMTTNLDGGTYSINNLADVEIKGINANLTMKNTTDATTNASISFTNNVNTLLGEINTQDNGKLYFETTGTGVLSSKLEIDDNVLSRTDLIIEKNTPSLIIRSDTIETTKAIEFKDNNDNIKASIKNLPNQNVIQYNAITTPIMQTSLGGVGVLHGDLDMNNLPILNVSQISTDNISASGALNDLKVLDNIDMNNNQIFNSGNISIGLPTGNPNPTLLFTNPPIPTPNDIDGEISFQDANSVLKTQIQATGVNGDLVFKTGTGIPERMRIATDVKLSTDLDMNSTNDIKNVQTLTSDYINGNIEVKTQDFIANGTAPRLRFDNSGTFQSQIEFYDTQTVADLKASINYKQTANTLDIATDNNTGSLTTKISLADKINFLYDLLMNGNKVIGNNIPNGNLTLESTSDVTKGNVNVIGNLNLTGDVLGNVYDIKNVDNVECLTLSTQGTDITFNSSIDYNNQASKNPGIINNWIYGLGGGFFSVSNSNFIINTTNEVEIPELNGNPKGSLTIPANSVGVGNAFRFVFSGLIRTYTNNQDATLRGYFGPPNVLTADNLWFEKTVTLDNLSAGEGAYQCEMDVSAKQQGGGQPGVDMFCEFMYTDGLLIQDFRGIISRGFLASQPAPNYTIANKFTFTWQWNVADANNFITCRLFTAELVI